MKKLTAISALFLLLPIASTFAGQSGKTASANLFNADGQQIGQAALTQAPTGVLFHIKVNSLAPGKHGLHLHSHGVCEAGTGFKSAKGHVGKKQSAHGLLNPVGPEPGDIPNIFISADGAGEMEAFSTLVSLSAGDNNLLDADGSTFIIHENGDDHITQPIGGAGSRVACGIVKAD